MNFKYSSTAQSADLNNQNNHGFSMIELMVVIAIISILAGVAIPNFIGWLPNYRLRSGAEDIQSTLQLARLTAIKENSTVTVVFDIGDDTFKATVGAKTFRSGKMPSGIDINSATFGGVPSVQFNGHGFLTGSAGSISVENSRRKSKTITVNMTGHSRIN